MSDLRMSLDCLLKKIGISHLIPIGSDEKLHSWVCQLLCVNKVSSLTFQHLNEMSSSLDCIITTEDKKKLYDIVSTYEKINCLRIKS